MNFNNLCVFAQETIQESNDLNTELSQIEVRKLTHSYLYRDSYCKQHNF